LGKLLLASIHAYITFILASVHNELKLATMALWQLRLSSKPCCPHIVCYSLDLFPPEMYRFCFAVHSSADNSCHCTHAAAAAYGICCVLPEALGPLPYMPEHVHFYLLSLHCMGLANSKASQRRHCDQMQSQGNL